jgi:copper transport protein
MRYQLPLRRVIAVLLLLGVPPLTAARRAAAPPPHLALTRSEPAGDSRLQASPDRVSLWFTARPQLALSRIALRTASGAIELDAIVADTGNALHARIPRPLPAGDYRVEWQTASADGHPIRGEFTFAVAASPRDAGATAIDSGGASTDPLAGHGAHRGAQQRDHTENRAGRWVEFVALITILGALAFRHGVLPPLASRGVPTADAADRARRLGQGAAFLYGLAAVVRLYTELVALNGQARALDPDLLVALLTRTSWGMGWLTGIIGVLLLAVGWTLSRRRMIMGTPLALTGALGLVAAPALTGHAASSDWFVAAVTLDMLHVLAAGIWLGGLFMVLVAGIPAMRRLSEGNPDAAVSALVNSFHPIALFCAPIVVAAGLGTSALRLGSFAALTTTRYGTTLLVKIALFTVVAGVALYNAMRARRQLGTPQGTLHVRRTAALELLFAVLVIAATAFLVTTPAPSLMARP